MIFVVVVSGLVLHVHGSEEAVLFLSNNEIAMKWTEYREAVGREIWEGELMFIGSRKQGRRGDGLAGSTTKVASCQLMIVPETSGNGGPDA